MYQFYEFCRFIEKTIDKCVLLWYNKYKVKECAMNLINEKAKAKGITIQARTRVDAKGQRRSSGGWKVTFAPGGKVYTYNGTLTEVAEKLGIISADWLVVAVIPGIGDEHRGHAYTREDAEALAETERQSEIKAAAWAGTSPSEIVVKGVGR